jgi:hypothetical protein
MEIVREDESYDTRNGAKYSRTGYVCRDDDSWVTVELRQGEVTGDTAAPR